MEIIDSIIQYLAITATGALVGWVLFAYYRRYTLGKYWGALIAGILGAALGQIPIFDRIIVFLSRDNPLHVNFIAALIGGYALVMLLHMVSPGGGFRDR